MKRMMKLTTLALLSLGMLAACGKKGSGGTAATTGLTQNCVNCAGITATQLAAGGIQERDAFGNPSNVIGSLQLFGQDVQIQNAYQRSMFGMGPQYIYKYYVGPVILAGQIVIRNQIQVGSCLIPAGSYEVRTVRIGEKRQDLQNPFVVEEVVLDGARDIIARVEYGEYFPSDRWFSVSFVPTSAPQIYNQAVNGPCM